MSVSTRPPAVAVMTKVPGPVPVKSRLHPLLGAEIATRLHECFLHDRLEALATVEGIVPVVAFTPSEARDVMARLAGPRFTLLSQRGPDLGDRLDALFREILAAGHIAAIAMDSDSPTLPMPHVAEAAQLLARGAADVVVGPCDDGGYYLIGVREPQPILFQAIPWSTGRVLALTLKRARRHGLRTHLLPPWFDVDTPADLHRLRDELAARPGGPPRTRAFLDALAAAGLFRSPVDLPTSAGPSVPSSERSGALDEDVPRRWGGGASVS